MRDSFVLYASYRSSISLLSMEQRGVLLTALFEYQSGGDLPDMDNVTNLCFSFIRQQLDRDADAYDRKCKKNAENIRKRWEEREKNNANARKNLRTQRKENTNIQTNTNEYERIRSDTTEDAGIISYGDNEYEYDYDYDNDLKRKAPKGAKRKKRQRFTPPTREEVLAYAAERNSGVDIDHFMDFYRSKGWKVGKDNMEDWKASFRNWERTQRQESTAKVPVVQKENGSNRFINYQQRDVDYDALIAGGRK